jgi:hypothetical protein
MFGFGGTAYFVDKKFFDVNDRFAQVRINVPYLRTNPELNIWRF